MVDKKVDVDAEFTDIPIEDGRVSGCLWDAEGRGKKGERVVSFYYLQDLDAKEADGKLGIGTN